MAVRRQRGSTTQDKVVIPNPVTGIQTKTLAGKPGDSVSNKHTSYFNKSVKQLRQLGAEMEAIRTLARTNGDVSAAVGAQVRLADTEVRYRVYDSNHQLSLDGSQLLRSILVRLDQAYDYTLGYDDRPATAGVIESLLRSVPLTGATAVELVLDEARLPFRLQPISVETIKFKTGKSKIGNGYKIIPYQTGDSGGDIDLDIPTFFYTALDWDPQSAYSFSPIEPSTNMAVFHSETVESIRRVVNRSGHSRLAIKILTEKLLQSAPADKQGDPAKLSAWVESVRASIQSQIEELSPEAALVFFDSIEADYLNSEIGASADYSPFLESLDGLLATSLKTPSAVVGKRSAGGSQNTSSTESLLFIKTAGGLHNPVKTVLSRALTLALRLYGTDYYVKVEFDPIDLRPEIELEAFKTMRQSRILEQLSLGFLSDDEAAELLHTGPRDPNASKLSGTGFFNKKSQEAPSPNDDPARRAMTTDAPKSAGGRDNSNNRS